MPAGEGLLVVVDTQQPDPASPVDTEREAIQRDR